MPREIKGLHNLMRLGGQHGARTGTGAVSPLHSGGTGGMVTDQVSITDAATSLRTTEKTLRELPVVDAARVGNIREAIAGGTYDVAPGQIADKLMQFELLFLGAGSHGGLHASA
jgi:flagellar biosynthesis anti-sigma factor FlgM